jgi:hypothetical protein
MDILILMFLMMRNVTQKLWTVIFPWLGQVNSRDLILNFLLVILVKQMYVNIRVVNQMPVIILMMKTVMCGIQRIKTHPWKHKVENNR